MVLLGFDVSFSLNSYSSATVLPFRLGVKVRRLPPPTKTFRLQTPGRETLENPGSLANRSDQINSCNEEGFEDVFSPVRITEEGKARLLSPTPAE